MAIQEVIRMGHPTLRLKAKALSLEEIQSDETRKLVEDMLDTMKEQNGIGIAAPQINISKQIAIIGIPPQGNERYPEADEIPLIVVINPKITILDETLQGFWEGCLSVPGLRGFVERPRKVKIEYTSLEGKEEEIVAEDFLATIFQHELDHLFGNLYIDKIKDSTMLTYTEEFMQFWQEEEEA